MINEGRFLVNTRSCPPFGEMLCLNLPKDADRVILCVNEGRGLIPLGIYLSHQIYKERIEEYRKKYRRAESFVVVPIRSNEYIQVWSDR